MEWVPRTNKDDHLYLAALHSPYSLVIWNMDKGWKEWKKSFTDVLSSFNFDPFDGSKLACNLSLLLHKSYPFAFIIYKLCYVLQFYVQIVFFSSTNFLWVKFLLQMVVNFIYLVRESVKTQFEPAIDWRNWWEGWSLEKTNPSTFLLHSVNNLFISSMIISNFFIQARRFDDYIRVLTVNVSQIFKKSCFIVISSRYFINRFTY